MDIIKTIIQAKALAAVSPDHERVGRPYRPGSGTEGMAFDEAWCDHCTRDKEYRDNPDSDPGFTGCQIIADTFAFDITDPRYPKEWIYGKDGRPCCTAFTTDPKKPIRCDRTIDMFADGQSSQKED